MSVRERFVFSLRAIPGIEAERARLRSTLAFQWTDDLQVGVEFNPLANDLGPIANWRAWEETERRPALILGTSSDRIGTPHGRAIYATLSKDLEAWTGLALAPYAGLAWGSFDDELVGIGGLHVRWSERISSTHLYDGEHLHHLANLALGGGRSIGWIVAEQDDGHSVGLSFSTGL